jgi:E3 Ubiquitin ligase
MTLIIGIVLIGIGIFLYFNRQKALNKAMDVKYYETSKINDLLDTYKHIESGIGTGNYNGGLVEVKGLCTTNQPLIAEHSEKPVVYYQASVERKFEVTEQERDSNGNYRTVVRTRTETVSSNTRAVPFYLNDGSGGQILVDTEGASVDAIQTFDRFDPNPPEGFNFSYGGGDSRTLGYSYREKSIPINTQLYVLGEISDRRGQISIVKPSEKGKNFIISTKSEEQIVKSAESSAQWQLYGAIGLTVGGVITIIAGFLG